MDNYRKIIKGIYKIHNNNTLIRNYFIDFINRNRNSLIDIPKDKQE